MDISITLSGAAPEGAEELIRLAVAEGDAHAKAAVLDVAGVARPLEGWDWAVEVTGDGEPLWSGRSPGSPAALPPAAALVDARCRGCERTSAYRLTGTCYNCGWPVLGLFTAGHEAKGDVLGPPCPACGCRRLNWGKLAILDEAPASAAERDVPVPDREPDDALATLHRIEAIINDATLAYHERWARANAVLGHPVTTPGEQDGDDDAEDGTE